MNDITPMYQKERLKYTAEIIKEKGRVTVEELSSLFNISLVTIRKDLKQLESEGLIERTHGGAICNEEMSSHIEFQSRKTKNKDKKQRIGKKAASLVSPGSIIFVGASTTTVEMCQYLKTINDLTVVTNSIEAAYILGSTSECNIIVIGGGLKKETLSLIDNDIERTFSNWNIDMSFFGGWGFSIQRGLTDIPGVLVQQKRVIASNSQLKVGLIDSTKIGKGSLDTFISTEDLDILITNADVPDSFIKAMEKTSTELILT